MRNLVRSKIDDRIHALIVMEVGCRELPEYSLGDILYSALRRIARLMVVMSASCGMLVPEIY